MCVDHSQLGASLDVYHLTTNALTRYRHTFTFRDGLGGWGGGGVGDVAAVTLLPEKYAMPECVIVEKWDANALKLHLKKCSQFQHLKKLL